jgi:hypothetical protein
VRQFREALHEAMNTELAGLIEAQPRCHVLAAIQRRAGRQIEQGALDKLREAALVRSGERGDVFGLGGLPCGLPLSPRERVTSARGRS